MLSASWVAAAASAHALASRSQAAPKAPPTSDELSTGTEGWPEGKQEQSLTTEELRVEAWVEPWVVEAPFLSMDETGTGDIRESLDDLPILTMIVLKRRKCKLEMKGIFLENCDCPEREVDLAEQFYIGLSNILLNATLRHLGKDEEEQEGAPWWCQLEKPVMGKIRAG
jgi:hypothetical protein